MCNSDCKICLNKENCYICAAGFFMLKDERKSTGKCNICDKNCLTCINSKTKCTSCDPKS